jgi:hypothetical protein
MLHPIYISKDNRSRRTLNDFNIDCPIRFIVMSALENESNRIRTVVK